ncbi:MULTISPECIES: bifunctional folylpolyglutamate synthase/dihydrofolate synthase [Henriciella]|uniref:Dihydrofolate synthase/folylpolyglutamate synthase n=2 Tax=Henriciella pelagia TaxID=1977912 RepID=A0ABQ1JPW9_9PROT|nr:folylpolyglutamate synthase/dihydrofolate synthase family protein [Henriciella pelagia]GGB71307.1 bifunctional folylpolyglutamate synthase/dihydrofolate synthase [Henriciella pelagia]
MIDAKVAVEAALKRFERFNPTERVLTLDRLLVVLETLGNPHLDLPPTIHVAGTNGKGSTTAFIRAMAEAAGLKVHVSTSPHLVRFNERIRLAGEIISDEALIGYLSRVEEALQGRDITHFEATQAAAFLAFHEVPADLLILEVGLGGRYDASNVIRECAVGVITPVDFDHMQFLGNTITQIASDKAGILKPGCAAVSAIQRPEAEAAIRLEAAKTGADIDFLTSEDIASIFPPLGLAGKHQFANAALAAKALRAWGHPAITDKAILTGCATAYWPARMQRLAEGPVTAMASDVPVWLDGGHNPHAARAIAETLDDLDREESPKRTMLVSAMLATKDAAGFFAELNRPGLEVFTTEVVGNDFTASAKVLAEAAQSAGLKATACESFEAAMRAAVEAGAERILICGSLYLAGDVLGQNNELPR